jgi:cyclopropane fatty-acyl-phospholipid synthase-like methyltransferase
MDRYQTTFDTWDKIASLYQQYFMDLDLYNDTYDLFCDQLKTPAASILEIGCGPGNITRYLLNKRHDLLIDATDIAPNMISLAKQNNPAANCMILDAREIHTLTKKYNGIMCGFCLPYLSKEDCAKLFFDCKQLLNQDGVLYCSALEGDHENSGFESGSSGDKAYVYYYEQDFLIQLLETTGFENIQTFRKQYQKKDGTEQIHLILIAHSAAS